MPQARPRKVILGLLPWSERQAVAEALRTETVGGLVLLAAAAVSGLATLAGIGFTVALLIGELAFPDPAQAEHVKAAVLVGSVIAAAVAAVLLRRRNRTDKRLYEEEERDDDANGIPDIYPSGVLPGSSK